MAKSRTTTLADAMAAAKVRGIDPTTVQVMSAADAAKVTADALNAAAEGRRVATGNPNTDPTTHQCGIPGCRHGATTTDGAHVTQPDRQVKLACSTCGAVARMTSAALHRAGGMPTCADGGTFAPAERRTYTRRTV